jgi:flagellar hook-associated protein 1
MRSTFFGLNTLMRALQAQQQALDTTNHNIANAGTDGYSRQQVSLTTTSPYTMPSQNKPASYPLHIGTGVVVSEIRRQRDIFLDMELRGQSQTQAQWDTLAAGLEGVEAVINEPGENNLRTQIGAFFNAWSDLSNNPQSGAARAAVRSTGDSLARSFNSAGERLMSQRQDVSSQVALHAREINDIGQNLAYLNGQIRNIITAGDMPNDMLDERDRLLDRLVQLTGATYRQDGEGGISVNIGSRAFVTGATASQITTEARYLPDGTRIYDVKWAKDFSPVDFEGGEVAGLVALRDEVLPHQLRQLDLLASTIAGNVNQVHRGGYGINTYANKVNNFFDPMTNARLSDTGLGHDLTAGTVTIGTTEVTIDPTNQSLTDVMDQITAAINGSAGVTGPAGWTFDPVTGRINITYQAATATTTVPLGAGGDTSNLLQLLGLTGATDVVTDPLTIDRQIVGLQPVALVSASKMSLDQAIRNSVDAIAAAAGASSGLSSSVGPSDNRNALALVALQRSAFGALEGVSFEDFYASHVADLGARSRQAAETAATQGMLVDHLKARRESFSGVSLDEEATQLIRFQRAYQAAARGISALDEMLDTIITRMGRVGN